MRWLLRALATLVMLAVVAALAIAFVPGERIARLAADRFTAETGRAMVFTGAVRPMIWPVLGVRAAGVEIGNAPWSDAGAMLRADAVEIGVDAAALLSGAVRIRGVEIVAPDILLETAADGRVNWDLAGSAARDASAQGPSLPAFTLDRLVITGGTVRLVDHGTGADHRLTGVEATLAMPAADGPATLDLAARLNGAPVSVAARVDRPADLLAGSLSPLRLEVGNGDNRLIFEGRAGHAPPAADGRLSLMLIAPASAAALAGIAPPDLPAGLLPLSLEAAAVHTTDGTTHLREAVIGLGAARLTGEADLVPGPDRPRLTARIAAGRLDLSALSGGSAGGGASAATGWSRATIDASALGLLDADVALVAESVTAGPVTLGRTDLRLALDRARAVTTVREVALYDGTLTGEFVVNGRGGLSMGGDLRLSGLSLRPALSALAEMDRLTGTGAGSLRFLAVGASQDALMRSLSGEAAFTLAAGEILGLDLAGMLRTLDLSYMGEGSRTIFDRIEGSFAIEGGVARTSDLAMRAPLVDAESRGSIDLGAQTVDLRVVPVALREADGTGGVRVPLLISGPWAAPRFRLDLEGLAEERLRAEREELEQRARDALAREAERRGIVAGEGERLQDAARRSLEDAARDRLEEEATRGLRRLLGGN